MTLRFLSNLIVSFVALAVLAGCAPNYLPIGDHKAFMDYYLPFGGNEAMVQALLCTPDESFCGRRKINSDEYDPDQFLSQGAADIEDDFEGWPLGFVPAGAESSTMQAGVFEIIDLATPPGESVRFIFNDLDYAEVRIPPVIEIIDPPFLSERSLMAETTLKVLWKSPKPDFPLHWEFFRLDNDPEEQACDLLVWEHLRGDAEDTGSIEIPLDSVPKDLPAEGCEAAFVMRRQSVGVLPPVLPGGHVRAAAVSGVIIRFLP